ncbi:DUF4136 domain-containing protein [Marinobacter salicampi]|uniref:DUF4136 domain-containing protein n=1 Tax=Marinobacter salicampi TaxID=435907 RepID=UPI00140ACDA4
MMRMWITSVMVLLLAGCASNVATDYDSGTEFASYDTWAFADKTGEKQALSLDAARIEAAIETALEGKNLAREPQEEADLLVSYGIETVERLDTTGFSYGLGLGRGPFGFGLSTAPPVREVEEGKLIVELIDSTSDRVVWRAASKRYLNEDQAPDTRRELIDAIVADMFSKYPPGG